MTEQAGERLATVPTIDAGRFVPNGLDDLDVVRIYNAELDAYGESPRAGVAFLAGWEVVEPTPEEAAELTSYDPAAHSAKEVIAKLEDPATSDGERDAILALEGADGGKQRTSVLSWAPAEESTP